MIQFTPQRRQCCADRVLKRRIHLHAAHNDGELPVHVARRGGRPTATKLFNAVAGTGQGHETFVATAVVAVPGNAYAGLYSSTWTFTVASGP